MSTPTIDQPRPVNGPLSAKLRTEPAVSVATNDKPMAGSAVRAWVVARTAVGGTLAASSMALADLSGLTMPGVNFATADLWAATFDDAVMPGANLAGCDLRTTSFRGTQMPGANLRGADLTGARFDERTDLTGAQYDDSTTWPADFTPPPMADVDDDES